MNTGRVKYITQDKQVRNHSWDNTKLVINTTENHGLYNNVTVSLLNIEHNEYVTGLANIISSNSFSIIPDKTLPGRYVLYRINGYLPGQTGPQSAQPIPRGLGTDAIIQSYVTGSNGANYKVEVSLDTEHWVNVASITHTSTTGDTGFITITPGWSHFRANVVAVGNNTLLTVMTGQ